MNKIEEAKKEVRHREWAERIMECRSSGLPIKEWCKQNGINVYTYYRRLRTLRNELLKSTEQEPQQIVPISVSNEKKGTALCATASTETNFSSAEKDKVIIRKGGIEIELPQSISEDMLHSLLKGLKQC